MSSGKCNGCAAIPLHPMRKPPSPVGNPRAPDNPHHFGPDVPVRRGSLNTRRARHHAVRYNDRPPIIRPQRRTPQPQLLHRPPIHAPSASSHAAGPRIPERPIQQQSRHPRHQIRQRALGRQSHHHRRRPYARQPHRARHVQRRNQMHIRQKRQDINRQPRQAAPENSPPSDPPSAHENPASDCTPTRTVHPASHAAPRQTTA